MLILNVWGSMSQAQCPLMMGNVGWQFPQWLEKHGKWLLLQAHYSPFKWRILTFAGWNSKCHVIIMMNTDLRLCCHNALVLLWTARPISLPYIITIELPLHTCPQALWQQTHPVLVLIPQRKTVSKLIPTQWSDIKACLKCTIKL